MSLRDISRRGFIIGTGTGAATIMGHRASAALASPPAAAIPRAIGQPMPGRISLPNNPPERPSEDSVGYAIVGLGGYSLRQIMPRFSETRRSHVAALVSGNPEKLDLVGEAYGVPANSRYSYDDFDRIAEDPRVDAVYIVLPSGLHCEFTERAFAAGKHVMCEKPMALSSLECDRMIEAGRRAGKKLMIGYRCHFEPYNLAAMQMMRDEAVGNLRLIRSQQAYRMGPTTPEQNWRANRLYAGNGPLEDFGIYGLQAALYLSNEMPTSLSAATFRPAADARFAEIFAKVTVQLNFSSGLSAQLSTSYDSTGDNSVDVYGTSGRLLMKPATGYNGQNMILQRGRDQETLSPGEPTVQFARQLDHLADAIRDGTKIRTPGEMGRRDINLIETIHFAASQGRTVALKPDGAMRR